MNKKNKRKLKWGFGLFILGSIILYIVVRTSPAREGWTQISSMLGPIGLLMSWPLIFASPFGIFASCMVIVGVALLFKLMVDLTKEFFGVD